MAESLWTAIDDYLATQVMAAMGSGGDYATLNLAAVYKWVRFDAPDFKGLQTPFGIVMSYDAIGVPTGHDGATVIKTSNTYMYALISVCDGTMSDATVNAKTLAWRQEKLLKSLRFVGVASDDGSKAGRIIRGQDNMLRTSVALWDMSTTRADKVYGLAITAFAVTGTTA